MGQFKSRFEMTVTVLEIKEQRSVRLQSEGQDRKLGTSTRGELEIKLEPNPSGGTVLDIGADIQVVGRLPVVLDDGAADLERTMEAVPGLLAAGVTDVRTALLQSGDRPATTDYLADVVKRFQEAAR